MEIYWEKLKPFFKREEVPAKTTLLAEGEISRKMFFIEEGCLRTWMNNDGKDITTQFFFEGDSVSSTILKKFVIFLNPIRNPPLN